MSAFSPKTVAVLGAGVMGRQIACDLGDKGFAVTLFDLPGNARKAMAAAVNGVKEVGGGVFSSFLTTCCVLGPLMFLTGELGRILRVLPSAIGKR